ncbi:MAG: hypothetical protein AMK75_06235 [Planctomycetes bacterium SM23_65]|nr:MAG: hypothetical protein AMK75_06235 [Planctomycetes bacterium SM23_65]
MPYLIAVLSVVVIVVFAAVVWRLAVWQNRRCFALLDDGAARNGFRIIERTYEQLWHGPFWWRWWYTDWAVYHVVVENPDGRRLTAHVLVSGWFRPTDLTVRWEDG